MTSLLEMLTPFYRDIALGLLCTTSVVAINIAVATATLDFFASKND